MSKWRAFWFVWGALLGVLLVVFAGMLTEGWLHDAVAALPLWAPLTLCGVFLAMNLGLFVYVCRPGWRPPKVLTYEERIRAEQTAWKWRP